MAKEDQRHKPKFERIVLILENCVDGEYKSTLAHILGTTHSDICSLVDKLTKCGLLEQKPVKRGLHYHTTEKGENFIKKWSNLKSDILSHYPC